MYASRIEVHVLWWTQVKHENYEPSRIDKGISFAFHECKFMNVENKIKLKLTHNQENENSEMHEEKNTDFLLVV